MGFKPIGYKSYSISFMVVSRINITKWISRGSGEKTYPDRDIELGDKRKANKNETNPGTPYAKRTSPGDLIETVALYLPAMAETDVRETDTSPAEEASKTGDGEQPVEELHTNRSLVDKSKETKAQLDDRGPDWTTLMINIRDKRWSHSLVRKGVYCSCRGEGT